MTIRNTITAELIWGSLWRASLYGVLLGAASGGLYGAAFGTLMFPLIGTAVGLFFGAITGAVVGLPLGVLNGILLSWLATAYRNAAPPNSPRYQLQAKDSLRGGKPPCATDRLGAARPARSQWFRVFRAAGLVLDLFLLLTGSGEGGSPDAVSLGALGILVFTPMLMILFASWLTGRFVAGWYAVRVCPAHPPSHGA